MTGQRRAFGERLRRQREGRGVALSTIAESTKVAGSLFAALERGDCARWPGGLYSRAFVKAYATAIGLDPDETAAEFAECFGPIDPPVEPSLTDGSIKASSPKTAPPSPLPPLRLSLQEEPVDRLRVLAANAALAVAEMALVAGIASIPVLMVHINLWISLSATSLLYLGAGRLLAGQSPAAWVVGRGRGALAAPPVAVPEEAPAGDAAATTA